MLIKKKIVLGLVISLVSLMSFARAFNYPETPRVDHTDDYFGVAVKDPYRWLEEDVRNSKKVENWVEAQNRVTFNYLDKIPGRDRLLDRLKELNNYDANFGVRQYGDNYFYYQKRGLDNHATYWVTTDLAKPGKPLLNPNEWAADGSIALSGTSPSPDGDLVAYLSSESGSDWQTIKIKSVSGKKTYDEALKWIKFSSISWAKDGSGFYYSGFPEPEKGQAFQSLNLGQKVYFHRLGTDQKADRLVFEDKANPEWGYGAEVSDDGKVLLITIFKGTDSRHRLKYLALDDPKAKVKDVATEFKASMFYLGNEGKDYYFMTSHSAPNNRIVKLQLDKPESKNWTEVVKEQDDVLQASVYANKQFYNTYLKDVSSRVRIFTDKGKDLGAIKLPGLGTVAGLRANDKKTALFYAFSSYNYPNTTLVYDIAKQRSDVLFKSSIKFDPDAYEVSQVFYPSKDGTRVPMFITHKKGLKLDGKRPTLLYGYGGFNISLTPRFNPNYVAWMEQGGVFAVANLRGGGEYGKKWHKAGTKLQKQNVFDDFIAAAEYLIKKQYTNNQKLAIHGGSNGGLLVAAVINQRPDLFAAGLPAVGVMDMLRFQHFTAGRYWVDDYGSSANKEEFKALLSYSPYHNVNAGTQYPAVLVLTGDTDDRVVPSHSFKYISALQAAQSGEDPVLIRISTKTGHGAGKSLQKRLEEFSDMLAFTMHNLGVKYR